MHRSGTSALARVLGLSGAVLPRHLVPPRAGAEGDANTRAGFWESEPLLALHEEALASAGVTWYDPYEFPGAWFESEICRTLTDRLVGTLQTEFGDAPLFVAKDPRISLLVPLWQAALDQLKVEGDWVISVRDPLSVAASLKRRDGFVASKGLLLWLTYFLAAERHTRDRRRLFVQYDDLLENWREVVARVGEHFGFRFPRRSHFAAAEIDDFVDPDLRHHISGRDELAARGEVGSWVTEAFHWAIEAAAGTPVSTAPLDAIARELHQAELLYGPVLAAAELETRKRSERETEMARELKSLRSAVAELAHQLHAPREAPAVAELEPAVAELEPAAEAVVAEPPPAVEEAATEPDPAPLVTVAIQAPPEPSPAVEAAPRSAAGRVRTLAFFLPQYHPIPENDEWWGRGFTEWTSVTAARPWFEGHRQPHLPSDLGFYDLRLAEVRAQQAALAREYGISGFCYYYYSFAGRRLLSRPIDEVLATGEPDFPFCLCWANENWTRRWDGRDDQVLIAQEHSPETDARLIDEVLPALLDPRYIRRGGEPLLLVYRGDLLVDPRRTTDHWRERACRAGLSGLHLCAVWKVDDPRELGFDALVEFPPHHFPHRRITGEVPTLAEGFEGEVFDYRAGVAAIEPLRDRGFPVYRGVMPGWDNTPRRGKQARIFAGGTPEVYGRWLEQVVRESAARPGADDQFVFINAWNEWAEGATIEPSRTHGRAFLEATQHALWAAAEEETELSRLEERMNRRLDRIAEALDTLQDSREETDALGDGRSPPRDPGLAIGAGTLELWRSSLAREAAPPTRELWFNPHFGALSLAYKLPLWLVAGRLPSRLRWWRRGRHLIRSGRFDPDDYRQRYPDVGRQEIDPLYHYVRCGEAEGLDPCASGWRVNPEHAGSRSANRLAILVVSHDAARAGAQLILLEALEHLVEHRNLEVFVLLLEGGEVEEEIASHVHTLRLDRVVAATGASRWEALNAVLGAFLWRRPLLAWCNTVVSSEAAVVCERLGLPVLSLIYELPTSIEATVGRRGLLELVAASRKVVVASHFVRDSLVESYGIDPERLIPLHTGVLEWDGSDGWRERCRAAVLAELDLPTDTFLVLGCGTIHPRKGTDLFVQVAREAVAMSGSERLFFLWIGSEQDQSQFRRWCQHDLEAMGLAGRVRLAGSRRSTADYFGAADAFALTSREDPFPMVGLEAMARGVPVVAFGGAGGAPEVLGEEAGVVVPYLDVQEMARSVVCLYEAPHFRAEIGRRARRKIEAHYQWSAYLRKLLGILENDFGYRPDSPAAEPA
jgi:glycosyltransferase involved in cell wall biosynthesis